MRAKVVSGSCSPMREATLSLDKNLGLQAVFLREQLYSEFHNRSPFPKEAPALRTAVIAVGGNAILKSGENPTQENQMKNVAVTCRGLAEARRVPQGRA